MKMVCKENIKNTDQREIMKCPERNKCRDCGVTFNGFDSECPICNHIDLLWREEWKKHGGDYGHPEAIGSLHSAFRAGYICAMKKLNSKNQFHSIECRQTG